MMRSFANLFLLLFVADGGMSLLDEFASLLAPLPALTEARELVAGVVIVLAEVLFLCLGIDKRLPKRVFLPLIAYALLYPVVQWLFPSLARSAAAGIVAALLQILFFLLVTRPFRGGPKPGVTMPRAIFEGPFFSLKNTLTFTAVSAVVVPCALVLMVLVTADGYMRKYTSGFMRVAPDGLHMAEKTYRRGNKTIRLAGMIHIGEKDYYDKVLKAAGPGRTIILAEGVTDKENLLRNRPDYGKLASYLGLASQQSDLHLDGKQIAAAELDKAAMHQRPDLKESGGADILRADVDISSFHPTTIWFLNEIGRQMSESRTFSKQLLGSIAWSDKNITPEMQKVITEDILYRRNQVLIGNLRKAVNSYNNILVPWGALHMAEIEQEVMREGFKLQDVRDTVSIRFFRKGSAQKTKAGS